MTILNDDTRQEQIMKSEHVQGWLANWAAMRGELEALITEHSRRDPALYFEPALANLELRDMDEAVHRIEALCRLLSSDDLTTGELEGTANS